MTATKKPRLTTALQVRMSHEMSAAIYAGSKAEDCSEAGWVRQVIQQRMDRDARRKGKR